MDRFRGVTTSPQLPHRGSFVPALPRRSNLFQDVVAIIHRHMAEGAEVRESAMLKDAQGDDREVDVTITAHQAVYEVIVSVEANARSRAATVEWVEQMLGKHQSLPTSKLVLVSRAGFSKRARAKAEAGDAVAIAPEDFAAGDPQYTIVNRLRSIWPKVVSFMPQRTQLIILRPPGPERVRIRDAMPDLLVYDETGQTVGTLAQFVHATLSANWLKIFEQINLVNIDEDKDEFFEMELPDVSIKVDGQDRKVAIRFEEAAEPELHAIESMRTTGRAVIHVAEIDLEHGRLGEVSYAYGEGDIGGQAALIVVTEASEGPQATMRLKGEGGEDIPLELAP
jgi:hypothetical protein